MNIDYLVSQPALFAALYAGYIVSVFWTMVKERDTKAPYPVISNNGSIMTYSLRFSLLSIILTVGSVALAVLALRWPGGIVPDWFFLSYPALFSLGGIALAQIAMLRANDAGKSRAFAFLGLIPIANLFLWLANPVQSPSRPAYTPVNKPIRFVIGFVAVLSIAVINTMIDRYSLEIEEEFAFTAIETNVAKENAKLPMQLDDVTILQSMTTDRMTREIAILYVVTDRDMSPASLQRHVNETVKPGMAENWCKDQAITEFGWHVDIQYETDLSTKLAETSIDLSDC